MGNYTKRQLRRMRYSTNQNRLQDNLIELQRSFEQSQKQDYNNDRFNCSSIIRAPFKTKLSQSIHFCEYGFDKKVNSIRNTWFETDNVKAIYNASYRKTLRKSAIDIDKLDDDIMVDNTIRQERNKQLRKKEDDYVLPKVNRKIIL